MKKFFSFLLCIVFLFASLSCGKKDSGEPDDKNSLDSNNAANETDGFIGGVIEDMPNPLDLPGEFVLEFATVNHQRLTVAVDFILELFKEKYPNVTVNVRLFDDAGTYAKELKELILSGEYIPDLFLAPVYDEFLDDAVMQSKLCDIYDLMYEDPRFDEGEWYMQLIGAYAQGGKLHEFPVNVMPVFFGVNGSLPDAFTENFTARSSIGFDEMIEVYWQNKASGLFFFDGQKNKEYYLKYSPYSFIDAETGLINITTPEFVKYAEFFLEISSAVRGRKIHEDSTNWSVDRDKEKSGLYMFNKAKFTEWFYILPSTTPAPVFAGMVPLADSDGKLILDMQTFPMRFSICAESKNQVAAWELIKFFASPAFYEDENRTASSEAIDYWFAARDNYMPVFKPTLKTKIDTLIRHATQIFMFNGFTFDKKVADADHAGFMMDFFERLMQYEFTYTHYDMKSEAMLAAYISYSSYIKSNRESDVPFEDVAEQVQLAYVTLMQNDPQMLWIDDILNNSEQNNEINYAEWRYTYLVSELGKFFLRYGFPE